jgi:hypothetical protein
LEHARCVTPAYSGFQADGEYFREEKRMDRHDVYLERRNAARRLRSRGVLAMVVLAIASFVASKPARAQFDQVPQPVLKGGDQVSLAEHAKAYRRDGAQHLYASYPEQIHKGKLPPLMYAIAIVETEIDENGQVLNARAVREPAAAKEVTPWLLEMIRRASPFPKPGRMGHVTYTDIWLVDKSGKFQLDTLSEGQR